MAGFADTDTLIDKLLEIYENVSSSDSDNTTRRARLLQYCQEALDEIWVHSDWLFSYKTGPVSITAAGDSGDLPSDFMEFGSMGGIFNDSTDTQFSEVLPVEAYGGVIQGLSGENEEVAAAYGNNTSTARRTLKLMGNAGTTTSLSILYRKTAPALVDTTGNNSNLWQLPESYHSTVLLPRILMKLDASHGDMNRTEQDYLRGLATMLRRERARKTTTQRLPGFFPPTLNQW
jgi:hypothetical protein